jgi:hypothetical protein
MHAEQLVIKPAYYPVDFQGSVWSQSKHLNALCPSRGSAAPHSGQIGHGPETFCLLCRSVAVPKNIALRHTITPGSSVLPELRLLSFWPLGPVMKEAARRGGRNETVPIRLICRRRTNERTCNCPDCRPEYGWPLLSISRASRCEYIIKKEPTAEAAFFLVQ